MELTAAGEAAFQRALGAVTSFDARLCAGFSAEELASLGDMLGRLRDNVTDATPAASP